MPPDIFGEDWPDEIDTHEYRTQRVDRELARLVRSGDPFAEDRVEQQRESFKRCNAYFDELDPRGTAERLGLPKHLDRQQEARDNGPSERNFNQGTMDPQRGDGDEYVPRRPRDDWQGGQDQH